LVPIAIQERAVSENLEAGPGGAGFNAEGAAYTLEARNKVQAVAFDSKGTQVQTDETGTAPTLRAMGHADSHQNGGGQLAVAFDLRGREGGAMPEGPHDTANIRAASGGSSRSYVAAPWAVRRLTPRECERLQGFPDDFTLVPYRGKPASDGPRYKALGNSWAVNCAEWIGERIAEVDAWT
jgi:DNA (cytosine-5)-methyltransferase 1